MPANCVTAPGTVCQLAANGRTTVYLPLGINVAASLILQVTADLATGAGAVHQVDATGAIVPSAVPDVPGSLATLQLNSGLYLFDVCPAAARVGEDSQAPTDFNGCKGHYRQPFYLRYTAGSPSQWPQFELWQTSEAAARCLVNGRPHYEVSDGLNSFAVSDAVGGRMAAAPFYAWLRARRWLPAAVQLQAELAASPLVAAPMQAHGSVLAASIRAAYRGKGDVCTALTRDLAQAWERATLVYRNGEPSCADVKADSPALALNTAIGTRSSLLSRCGRYKASTAGDRAALLAADCALNLAPAAGVANSLASERNSIDGFLAALSASRQLPTRPLYGAMAEAMAALPANLSALDPTVATYDDPLRTFLAAWAGLAWQKGVAQIAGSLLASFAVPIVPTSDALEAYRGQTGRAVLLGWLADPAVLADINSRVCVGAKAINDAFAFAAETPALAVLYADLVRPATATGNKASWRAEVSAAQRCADLASTYAAVSAKPQLSYCPAEALRAAAAALQRSCADPGSVQAASTTAKAGAELYPVLDAALFTAGLRQAEASLFAPGADGQALYLRGKDSVWRLNPDYSVAAVARDEEALRQRIEVLARFAAGADLHSSLILADADTSGEPAVVKLQALTAVLTAAAARDAWHSDQRFRAKIAAISGKSPCAFGGSTAFANDAYEPATRSALPPEGSAAALPDLSVQIDGPTLRQLAGIVNVATPLAPTGAVAAPDGATVSEEAPATDQAAAAVFAVTESQLTWGDGCLGSQRQTAYHLQHSEKGQVTFTWSSSVRSCASSGAGLVRSTTAFLHGVPLAQ